MKNASMNRLHYMDNLRALAMLLGIFFHAALAYNPMMHNIWLSASKEQAVSLEVVAWFTHLFRMPLFFIISGFFAHLLMQRRGLDGFLRNRLKRIFLPFMIFLPMLTLTTMAIVGWGMSTFPNLPPVMDAIRHMQNQPDASRPPLSTMHLWFLFNLMLFCLVSAVFKWLDLFSKRWVQVVLRPSVLLFMLPCLLVPALLSVPMPHPAPEKIYPQLWSFGFNGIFFLIGILLYQQQQVIDALRKYVWVLITFSLIGYAFFYHALPKNIPLVPLGAEMAHLPINAQRLFLTAIEAYVSVWMSLACLVLGKRLLNRSNRHMRYISDASYWVYIIHLPVVFIIQFHLLRVEWGAWIEFSITSLLTLIIGFISYTLFVRSTPIGLLLNGKTYRFGFRLGKLEQTPHPEMSPNNGCP